MTVTTNDLIRKAITSFRAECRGVDDEAASLADAALDGSTAAAVEVLAMLGARAADEDLALHAERGGACVRDSAGGAWWPSDEVAADIGGDSLAMLATCDIAPMLGTWHD